MRDMRRQSFLQGAMLLTITGLINKALGAVYLIPLTRLIGAEGIGLYQMAYSVYGTILVVSSSGLPIAISKLVSERLARGEETNALRVFRVSLIFLLVTGIAFSVFLSLGASTIARRFLGDPRSYYTIKNIAPAVFLVAVMSAFRGYFQGRQIMLPTALSQLSEQVVRVSLALFLAYILLPRGVEFSAAGSAMGAVGGAFAGLLVLIAIYIHERAGKRPALSSHIDSNEDYLSILGELVSFAIPITIGSLIAPLGDLANAAIIPARLRLSGKSMAEATALYGQLSAMGMSLIALPTVFTTAFATSLVPIISASMSKGNLAGARARAREAIRFTLIIALPAFVGLRELAWPICDLLFGCREAGNPLSVLAAGVIFLCLQQTISGLLHGLGMPLVTARNLLIGIGTGAGLNYYLAGIPGLGIRGAAFGTITGFAIVAFLNFVAAAQVLGDILDIASALRVTAISLILGPLIRYAYGFLLLILPSSSLATIACIFMTIPIYLMALLLIREVTVDECRRLPYAGWIINRILR